MINISFISTIWNVNFKYIRSEKDILKVLSQLYGM